MNIAFDRGTITLSGAPDGMDLLQLPGVAWDDRVRRFRAPARCHAEIVAELTARGVRFSDTVRRTPPDTSWIEPELRSYQRDAVEAWESAGRRGVIALPTGSGKTRVAIAAAARVGARALILVPTRALLDQWAAELARFYPAEVGRVGDGVFEVKDATVCTFESAWRHMAGFGDRFELLVVDEVHHFGNGLKDEALEMCAASFRMGLTATPPRDERTLLRLDDLVGPIVFEMAIADLTGTHLANFELVTIGLELTEAERETYDEEMRVFRVWERRIDELAPDATWPELTRLASRTTDGTRALEAFRNARQLLAFAHSKRATLGKLLAKHRESRVLVFTADNESAYAIAREHLVMPITCEIGRAEREAALGRFKNGELRALVSARVLNEGLDVPDADVAIIVAGSFGEREHTQRVGRLLRPAVGKRARIYELVMRRTMEVRQAQRRREGLVVRSAAHA